MTGFAEGQRDVFAGDVGHGVEQIRNVKTDAEGLVLVLDFDQFLGFFVIRVTLGGLYLPGPACSAS